MPLYKLYSFNPPLLTAINTESFREIVARFSGWDLNHLLESAVRRCSLCIQIPPAQHSAPRHPWFIFQTGSLCCNNNARNNIAPRVTLFASICIMQKAPPSHIAQTSEYGLEHSPLLHFKRNIMWSYNAVSWMFKFATDVSFTIITSKSIVCYRELSVVFNSLFPLS